jgi:hypothetical protein
MRSEVLTARCFRLTHFIQEGLSLFVQWARSLIPELYSRIIQRSLPQHGSESYTQNAVTEPRQSTSTGSSWVAAHAVRTEEQCIWRNKIILKLLWHFRDFVRGFPKNAHTKTVADAGSAEISNEVVINLYRLSEVLWRQSTVCLYLGSGSLLLVVDAVVVRMLKEKSSLLALECRHFRRNFEPEELKWKELHLVQLARCSWHKSLGCGLDEKTEKTFSRWFHNSLLARLRLIAILHALRPTSTTRPLDNIWLRQGDNVYPGCETVQSTGGSRMLRRNELLLRSGSLFCLQLDFLFSELPFWALRTKYVHQKRH